MLSALPYFTLIVHFILALCRPRREQAVVELAICRLDSHSLGGQLSS